MDMVLMVERSGGEDAEHWSGKPRELMVLLGAGEGYTQGPLSRKVVRWSGEGGMNPEPYNGMSVDENGLIVREWGTRWDEEMTFTWQEGGLQTLSKDRQEEILEKKKYFISRCEDAFA